MAAADGSAIPEKEGSSATPQRKAEGPEGVTPAQLEAMTDEEMERYLGNRGIEPPDLGTIPDPGAPTIDFAEVAAEEKADAAVAEAENANHKVTYKVRDSEVELQLPSKLAASVVYRAGVLRDDDGAAASKLIQAVIGPDQFEIVLDKMDAEGLTIDDEDAMTSVGNLINAALAVYGVTPGESEASPS